MDASDVPAGSFARAPIMGWSRRTVAGGILVVSLLAGVAGVGFVLDHAFPPDLSRLSDISVTIRDRQGRPLRLFTNREDKWRLPATPDAVSPIYLDLLRSYEDRRFDHHFGIDPVAILRAIGQNLTAGQVVSGASTLTMQVARLLEPRPRTWAAKLIEMARALQLEYHYDKETILSMYLTLAPFGGNLEGVAAASRALFGKPPHALSVGEAALLVALPQAPSRLRPDRFPERAGLARDKVIHRAVAAGAIDRPTAEMALSEQIRLRNEPMPQAAFHLAERMRARYRDRSELATTIDGPVQAAIEALARRAMRDLHLEAGLAILLVENRERTVAAYLGAPDPLDHRRLGPIDMVEAVRSPGSALKPFIYGLGFDDRVIHPDTLVSDVSTRFGGYAPSNFSGGFSGDITVRQALQQSLNVPAVMVLARVGAGRMAAALYQAGMRLVLPKDTAEPGLPLALGGVSVNLWDMVTLYAGLANGGIAVPLTFEPGRSKTDPGVRFMSEMAAWEVIRILEGTPPPPGLVQAASVTVRGPIALKTGTSYGFRDAWAFGVTRGYTAGVWVGRPDGTPSPDRYGRNTAAPLLYQIFDLLPSSAEGSAAPPAAASPPPPDLLRRLEVTSRDDRPIELADSDRLRLVFPTPEIVLDLTRANGGYNPLALQASGGRRPLTWLVNGDPIDSRATRRDAVWLPTGPGFVQVTVIDADGRVAGAQVRVR